METKLSQEFSRTESWILRALFNLNEFLLNPQNRAHSRSVLETSWKSNGENQEANEDRSQSHCLPEVRTFFTRSPQNSEPEETSYIPSMYTLHISLTFRTSYAVQTQASLFEPRSWNLINIQPLEGIWHVEKSQQKGIFWKNLCFVLAWIVWNVIQKKSFFLNYLISFLWIGSILPLSWPLRNSWFCFDC